MKFKTEFIRSKNEIAIFSSSVAIVLSLIYATSRIGFSTDVFSIARTLGLSLLIIFIGLQSLRNSFLCLIFLCFLGFGERFIPLNISSIVALAGFILFFRFFTSLLRDKIAVSKFFVVFSLLFAVWVAGVVWGSGYHNPLTIENIANFNMSRDILIHSTLSGMIRTYGVPSTGLNGLPYFAYHVGSHWIFALLGSLLRIDSMTFYQLAYPIIFIPFFFFVFLTFVLKCRTYMNITAVFDRYFWLFLGLSFIGILPLKILVDSGIWKEDLFISESYLTSITFSFFLFSLWLDFLKLNRRNNYQSLMPLLLFTSFFIGFIGFFKGSLMILLSSLYVYFFLKNRLYRKKIYLLPLAVLILICVKVYSLINAPVYNSEMQLYFFHFISTYVTDLWKPFFILFNFFWVFLFIALKLSILKVSRFSQLKKAFVKGVLTDMEVLVGLSLIGILPALFVSIPSGGAFYFFDFQRWAAIGLLLAYTPYLKKIIFHYFGKINVITAFFFLLPFTIVFFNNATVAVINLVQSNLSIRKLVLNYSGKDTYVDCLTKRYRLGKIPELLNKVTCLTAYQQRSLDHNSNFQVLRILSMMNSLPQQERQNSLLYIPKTNTHYWEMVRADAPFIAPAISGIAMIKGLPEKEKKYFFGMEAYKKPNPFDSIDPTVSRQKACVEAKKMGFKKIIIFNDLKRNGIQTISCNI